MDDTSESNDVLILAGTICGVIACFVFTILHQITISNIWFSFPFMAIIAAIAGLSLVFAYNALFEKYSVKSWLAFNFYYIISLGILGILSFLLFTPRMTSEEILNTTGGAPTELIIGAMPLNVIFMTICCLFLTYFVTGSLRKIPHIFGSFLVIFLTLGLNISLFGFIDPLPQHRFLMLKFWGLILTLGGVYASVFALIKSKINQN